MPTLAPSGRWATSVATWAFHRRDDEDVAEGEPARAAGGVGPLPLEQVVDEQPNGGRLLGARLVDRHAVHDRSPAQTGAADSSRRGRGIDLHPTQVLPGVGLRRGESALVGELGHEAGEVGVHAVGVVEEHASVGRDNVVRADEVLEHRDAGTEGMHGLGRLLQLLGVAQQHERGGRLRHRHGVGERELPGLVDDEHVDRPGEVVT